MTAIGSGLALSTSRRLLNVGCGNSFHLAWTNLDTAPAAPGIMRHDLTKGLPFPADFFDAVYSSHVLEHLKPAAAQELINECHRVLKPGGVARIVVPDLEAIARLYLACVEDSAAADAHAAKRYDWLMLELYDQTVRTESGGQMRTYMRSQLDDKQRRFVSSRVGEGAMGDAAVACVPFPTSWRWKQRLRSMVFAARRLTANSLAFLALGREGTRALNEGLFRRSGEIHHWMYDRYSLGRVLQHAGFTDIRIRVAEDSSIPQFAQFGLETFNGKARKPDSLYMEGRKPAPSEKIGHG